VCKHPFHIVRPSPWPVLVSSSSFFLALGLVWFFSSSFFFGLGLGLFRLILLLFLWFRSIVVESTYTGAHTTRVQVGLRLGFLLFILSEVFFFISFF